MTMAMLTASERREAGSRSGESLDEALRALVTLGVGECLVCGAVVEVGSDGRVCCGACGSELGEPAGQVDQDQLAMG